MASRGDKNAHVSTFTGGLNTDFHPLAMKNTLMSDALNAEILSVGDGQYMLKNIKGEDKGFVLTADFVPIAIKLYNNVAYIISAKFAADGTFEEGELGTYPSPDWSAGTGIVQFLNVYSPLKNFLTDEFGATIPEEDWLDDSKHTMPFRTALLGFDIAAFTDLTIQKDYDESVNFVFVDGINPIRLINSRFKVNTDGTATIIDREQKKDTSTYSSRYFQSTELIIKTDKIPQLVFDGVDAGGRLKGGGYRYFFRYKNMDGNVSDIIEESRLVIIAEGQGKSAYGVKGDRETTKQVTFTLSNLKKDYDGIEVSYTHIYGDDSQQAAESFIISTIYPIDNGTCRIIHTGVENATQITEAELTEQFSSISTAKTLDQVNNRLVLGNVTSAHDASIYSSLVKFTQDVQIHEEIVSRVDIDYSDPMIVYSDIGYWKGETYELAIVYILKETGALTPAIPLRGIDNYDGTAVYSGNPIDPENPMLPSSENILGVYRTNYFERVSGDNGIVKVTDPTFLKINMSDIYNNLDIIDAVAGFFIVRKERIKDTLYQGYVAPTVQLPSTNIGQNINDFKGFTRNTIYGTYDQSTLANRLGVWDLMKKSSEYDSISLDFSYTNSPYTLGFQLINCNTDFTHLTGIPENSDKAAIFLPDLDLVYSEVSSKLSGKVGGILIGDTILEHSFNLNNPEPPYLVSDITNDSVKLTNTDNVLFEVVPAGFNSIGDGSFTSESDRVLNYLAPSNSRHVTAVGFDKPCNETSMGLYADDYFIATGGTSTSDGNDNVLFNGIGTNCTTNWRYKDYVKGSDYANAMWGYKSLSSGYTQYIGITNQSGDFEFKTLNPDEYGYSLASILAGTTPLTGTQWQNRYISSPINNYFAISKRFALDLEDSTSLSNISITSGDCYIGEFSKKLTYALGISEDMQAGPGDVPLYGYGPTRSYTDIPDHEGDGVSDDDIVNKGWANTTAVEKDDRGRRLVPHGIFLTITCQTNHNPHLRGVEESQPEEMARYGIGRSFYPKDSISKLRNEYRPDSKAYNIGYTGDYIINAYSAININNPINAVRFPNRVMISPPNTSSEFYNAYRDFTGFNFRDYNSEFGEIVKLISHNNILFAIFETGIAVITVDGRTLINSQDEIFVDEAKVLAPKATILSAHFGSINPESIIASATTVYGVDYIRAKVWRIEGRNIKILSDYAVDALIREFKKTIDSDASLGVPKLYTSYDAATKDVSITFNKLVTNTNHYHNRLSLKPNAKAWAHTGSLHYNEVMSAWVSRVSKVSKFQALVDNKNYRFDLISDTSQAYETGVDNGTFCLFNDVQYPFEIEFVVNSNPTVEKILDNLKIVSNKRKPVEIEYYTTSDIPDSVLRQNDLNADPPDGTDDDDHYYNRETLKILHTDNIKTREDSIDMSIGIFFENAYYKDGAYHVQVGKNLSFSRFNRGQRRVRDKYFIVKLKYTGKNYTYINAVMALFTINFD